MQLVGCNRIQEEITRNITGATTPREEMPKRRTKATVCSWWAVTAYTGRNNKKQNRGHHPKGADAQTAQEGHA
jgi:hypothetical protein